MRNGGLGRRFRLENCLREYPLLPSSVILGLDPRIHAAGAAWKVGSSPTMTRER
jgi:hypothetical protein